MAGEIQLDFDSGVFPWVTIWNAVGQVWDTISSAFVSYATANLARYAINLTEQGTASGIYLGTFPSAIGLGIYKLVARYKAAAIDPPAEANPRAGHGVSNWDGAALVPVTSAAHIADTYLDRPNAIAGNTTPREHMRRVGATAAGTMSGAGSGTETFQDYAGNNAVVMTTPDEAGNRTAAAYP